jgi:DNA-binding NarL/FixJ family response regulator
MQHPPRLILADDHALMLDGLRAILEPAHEIVDVVRDGREVRGAAERHRPDLVLLDLSLPGRSGLEVAAEMKAHLPEVRTLILTMHAERIYADEAIRAGAMGYVLKLAKANELRFAIAEALAGRIYVTPMLGGVAPVGRVEAAEQAVPAGLRMPSVSGSSQPELDALASLTERQRNVIRLIALGRTTEQIGHELGISTKSVEFHRGRIKQLLGLNSTAALVRWAVGVGLV